MGERAGADYSRVQFFFVGGPSSLPKSGGVISGMGYLVPQPFTIGGNQVIFRFFGP
jgi:hypothetical protein